MSNDKKMSIAIRREDGTIGVRVKKRESLTRKYGIFDILIIRGIVRFLEGATDQFYAEEQMKKIETDNKDSNYKNQKSKGKKSSKRSLAQVSVLLTIIGGIMMYFIIPTIIAFFSKQIIKSDLVLGGMEAVLRLLIFLTFFSIFSLIERANGTAMYHGAEHKSLWSYIKGEDLALENARKHPIRHPSCGTSLLFFMIIISIPFFLFLNYENLLLRIIIMLILLPLIIGIAFEITIWLDKSQSKLARIISMPGLFLQRLNTKEPDDNYLEVALVSLKNLINY